jgi:hypothetical protein
MALRRELERLHGSPVAGWPDVLALRKSTHDPRHARLRANAVTLPDQIPALIDVMAEALHIACDALERVHS